MMKTKNAAITANVTDGITIIVKNGNVRLMTGEYAVHGQSV